MPAPVSIRGRSFARAPGSWGLPDPFGADFARTRLHADQELRTQTPAYVFSSFFTHPLLRRASFYWMTFGICPLPVRK